jgi:hypothetical protein
VNRTTEAIATLDTSLSPFRRRRHRQTCRAGRHEGQPPMRSMAVVVLHEDVENPLKMLGVQDQQPVETLSIAKTVAGRGRCLPRMPSGTRSP